MSDLDDMLLAMAEPVERKRKAGKSKAKSSTTKRPRPAPAAVAQDAGSDMDMSSDESDVPLTRKPNARAASVEADSNDEGEGDDENVYPLEGKYKDAADRSWILGMNELERENILGERSERQNAETQRQNLRMMVRAKEQGLSGATGESPGKQGGRDRTQTGATNAKKETLLKLKKSREMKGKKSATTVGDDDDFEAPSPRRRRDERSYSEDTEGEEEGEVESYESPAKKGSKKDKGEPAGPADLREVQVTRTKLAEFCAAPWFADWVKGAWVRYLIGKDQKTGEPTYRLCQVVGVKEVPQQSYKLENKKSDLQIELKFGEAAKFFTMEGVSNSPFTDREYARLSAVFATSNLAFPYQSDVHKVRDSLAKRKEYIMTEADVAALLAKKGGTLKTAQGRAKLLIQRDFARSTGDAALEVQVLAKLAELEAPPPAAGTETEADRMTKVNERNRKGNREQIKKAESRNQDARMKQTAALARGDTSVKVDASARVKTMPRMNFDSNPSSQPGTPQPGTPNNGLAHAVAAGTPLRAKSSKFEEMVASRVQVDIDLDF